MSDASSVAAGAELERELLQLSEQPLLSIPDMRDQRAGRRRTRA